MYRFFIIFLYLPSLIHAQPLAFPGAEGGGKYTTGGRGGKVLLITNLNDKGEGSFRDAVETEGARMIVFKVSGNIELNKPIDIKHGDVTIAGQSAPGDGICLKNFGIKVRADNVIIRYIRVRPGDQMEAENDAITATWQKYIIIDHCSMSWATDEVGSFYNNTNFTLQWCILSESLYKSVHHKGQHGYGGIWGGYNASFHHNLISDHSSRNPRFCGSRYTRMPEMEVADMRNNVIYNWGYNSIYGGEEGHYNIVNNYFKPGPATAQKCRNRILDLTQAFYDTRIKKDTMHAGWFYIDGNVMEGHVKTTNDNWAFGVQGKGVDYYVKQKSMASSLFASEKVETHSAEIAYGLVLKFSGPSLSRDETDQRIIDEVRKGKENYGGSYGKGTGIIDSQDDVGGWPVLNSVGTPDDTDSDGMPDEWEVKNKLNPNNPMDSKNYDLDKYYTNIEVYLNSIVNHLYNHSIKP